MFQKNSLGIDEALGAIHVMLDAVRNGGPDDYWQYASMAIVDEAGQLVAFARMDGLSMMTNDIAIRMARTAAAFRRDIVEVNAYVQGSPWDVSDFCGEWGTRNPGGVAIVDPREVVHAGGVGEAFGYSSCIGGIGVSAAGPWQKDLEICGVGLRFIQEKLWP
jgi:uncharacterized protein GlcG (DUF336 family)